MLNVIISGDVLITLHS